MNARSGAWESSDSGVAIISSRTKNMSVEDAQFVTFLKVESQRIEGRSGFVLIYVAVIYRSNFGPALVLSGGTA